MPAVLHPKVFLKIYIILGVLLNSVLLLKPFLQNKLCRKMSNEVPEHGTKCVWKSLEISGNQFPDISRDF